MRSLFATPFFISVKPIVSAILVAILARVSIAVIFVTVCRVDLVKEDLTVELAKECLYQFKDALIQFFTLSAIFHLFIHSDIASMLCC